MSNLVTRRNQVLPIAARSIAVAAALCCAGLASAQTAPSVTLYGLVDAGITSVSGLKNGTVTQVASGIMEGTRWGVKGNEDLGDGYRAIFTLESRVELDTGANSNRPISGSQLSDRFSNAALLGLPSDAALSLPAGMVQGTVNKIDAALANEFGVNVGAAGNRAFDRQAFVGLVTPFGGFLAGRQYTPAFETTATYDIMETQSGLAAGQIVAFPAVLEIRKSNSLAYRFVKDGISGSLMYAAGEVAGDSAKSRMLGMNVNYKADMFAVGFGYNTANNELGNKSLTTAVLGASMNFGSSKVSSFVAKITDDNPSNLSVIAGLIAPPGSPAPVLAFGNLVQSKFIEAFKQDGTLFHIGYRYVTGASTISVAYSNYNDNRPADADVRSYGAAYTYALSKRTDLNAVLVHYDNKNLAQVAPGGNGYIGGITASAGTDSNSLALGIRHRF
ncbi:porin [Rhodoferax sp.]|uniref:porin n=1 Tax=Rhodoferax sp. TaxID=50421 RepID=UPI00374D03AE